MTTSTTMMLMMDMITTNVKMTMTMDVDVGVEVEVVGRQTSHPVLPLPPAHRRRHQQKVGLGLREVSIIPLTRVAAVVKVIGTKVTAVASAALALVSSYCSLCLSTLKVSECVTNNGFKIECLCFMLSLY